MKRATLRTRIAAAIAAFKSPPEKPTYVVIYDREEIAGGEITEEYYGYFGSIDEALGLFNECWPDRNKVYNAFLCRIEAQLRPNKEDA